jgi:serine/threonine protein kinase
MSPDAFSHPAVFDLRERSARPCPLANQEVLDDFTERWDRGEVPSSEAYLALVGPLAPRLAVEVIYREYCLAERDGRQPDDDAFLARFPRYREALEPLLAMRRQCSLSEMKGWIEPEETEEIGLPDAGDQIGPYMLRRELGRGAFARVFLAEQADLEYRQVVVKVSTRPTREPWLLARVRHAHIVEILSHAEVDDGAFQLICMPFLGGATLSTLLASKRKKRRARSVKGGLLEDLDAVAAPEYAGVNPARPARELLLGLTDHQAMAWITARLAEALDHAFSRDVAHGDVKPSNIILTADGNPMLLDFNLAQDWSPQDTNPPLEDHGGTLAYMAPERLRALASIASEYGARLNSSTRSKVPTSNVDPHRADIYALGKVLLEALTGTSAKDLESQERPGRAFHEAAARYADDGELGAAEVVRRAEALADHPIPRALRVILERCLAVNPDDRYRRSLELAEDLDRWRTDRPLAYAVEPFWAQTLPRWVRRRRSALSAAALVVVVSSATGYLILSQSRSTLLNLALHRLSRSWDDIESHAFQLQRPGRSRLDDPSAPELHEVATHALKEYEVLENRDWRGGEAIKYVSARDREDLELWLMEQAFRYCRTLSERIDHPDDWQRARATLDWVDTSPSLTAFDMLRRRIDDKLARNAMSTLATRQSSFSPLPHDSVPPSTARLGRSAWLDDYLMGLSAELDEETTPNGRLDLRRATTALAYYGRLLAHKPDSFWGHYRYAVVSFRLRQWSEAASHLNDCLRRRPGNAALRGQYASCLWELGLLDEALNQCSRTIESAPDQAEFYQERGFVRALIGQGTMYRSTGWLPAEVQGRAPALLAQIDGLAEDLNRFEQLRRSFYRPALAQRLGEPDSAAQPLLNSALSLVTPPGIVPDSANLLTSLDTIDRVDLDARAWLAWTICRTGLSMLRKALPQATSARPSTVPGATPPSTKELAIGTAEVDKVLTLSPGHLSARMSRMLQSLMQGRLKEAQSDLELVLNHPDLAERLRTDPDLFEFFRVVARRFAHQHLFAEALRIADAMISMSEVLDTQRGRSHYCRAMVLAMAASEDPSRVALAAEELDTSFQANARFWE